MAKCCRYVIFIFLSIVSNISTSAQTIDRVSSFSIRGTTDISSAFINTSVADDLGNIILSGRFYGVIDVDPGPGTYLLSTSNPASDVDCDIFVVKYSPTGTLLFAFSLGSVGVNFEEGTALDADETGNIYLTGHFKGSMDFDPSSQTQLRQSKTNFSETFWVKYVRYQIHIPNLLKTKYFIHLVKN